MREASGRLRLAAKALTLQGITCQRRQQRFERHRSFQACVVGQVHTPHASATQLANDDIWTEPGTGFKPSVLLEEIRQAIANRLRKEGAGPRVMVEERQRLSSD
jgi:hypothetical protein